MWQKNKKSRSVTIQIPEDHASNNKEPRNDNTQDDKKPRSDSTPNDPISRISDIHELRSEDKSQHHNVWPVLLDIWRTVYT